MPTDEDAAASCCPEGPCIPDEDECRAAIAGHPYTILGDEIATDEDAEVIVFGDSDNPAHAQLIELLADPRVLGDFNEAYKVPVIEPLDMNPADHEFEQYTEECRRRVAEMYQIPAHLIGLGDRLPDPTSYITATQVKEMLLAFFGGRPLCRRRNQGDRRKRGDVLRGERRGYQSTFKFPDRRHLGAASTCRRLFRGDDRRCRTQR
jgi:hypothetical protein